VDVVIPFFGPRASLERLVEGASALRLGPDDTLTIADNRPAGAAPVAGRGAVCVVAARERLSSYYARNIGAAHGSTEWILFLDADARPVPDLLDRYFERMPGERAAVLAGAIEDEDCEECAPAAARFAALAGAMSQGNTLGAGRWSYVQTANCAIRRSAFEQVGGFEDAIRSGGDADICFRLRAAGWEIEPRRRAAVVHSSRRELGKLLRQRARMGAGAAWVNERHPGSFPPRRLPGLAVWSAGSLARACTSALGGRRDEAILRALDPLTVWAFELGRRLPNRTPAGGPPNGAGDDVRTVPVSVVIPAYNSERMLQRALQSVLVQRPAPAEIVVVDDASTDGTAAVAEEMGARVIRHERNLGEGAARNSGIAAATQPWVALLDSDDEWLPHHLHALWRGRGDHAVVATSAMRCAADPALDRLHGSVTARPLEIRSPAAIVFPENPLPVSAVMLRRDAAKKAGGYHSLPHCGDFDFLLRCLEHGSGVVLPDVGVLYHVHAEQVSQQRELMKAAHTRIAGSYSDRPWFDGRQLRRWRASVAWDLYRLEGGARRAAALARPGHLPALIALWTWRLRLRRRSSAIGRDGGPSLAILPGATGAPEGFARVHDLREHTRAAAFARLVRRPAGVAVVGSRLDALAARVLGMAAVEGES
jgi:glycosyltransferase involved in cell wall biosynthesis